ncbi:hypothetical protein [Psychrobacter sp. ANT_WB68]|nr:hypothetical protein [Psychrobacter sp. ANT_WB68]
MLRSYRNNENSEAIFSTVYRALPLSISAGVFSNQLPFQLPL